MAQIKICSEYLSVAFKMAAVTINCKKWYMIDTGQKIQILNVQYLTGSLKVFYFEATGQISIKIEVEGM